jgi:hypothetical protein
MNSPGQIFIGAEARIRDVSLHTRLGHIMGFSGEGVFGAQRRRSEI